MTEATTDDGDWFETEDETPSFQKEFVALTEITPADILIPQVKYSYDVRDELMEVEFCGWGDSLKETFEQGGQAMYAYLYDLSSIDINGYCLVEAEGRDLADLFYRFMDELQFALGGEPNLLARRIDIQEFDEQTFLLRAKVYGERFNKGKHHSDKPLSTILKENVSIERTPEGQYKVYYIIDM